MTDIGKQQAMERVICSHIRDTPGVLYDIGVGPKSEWQTLRDRYPSMSVFGCEPHEQTYHSLLRKGFPGTLWNVAIGRHRGIATLYYRPDDPKITGLIRRDADHSCEQRGEMWTLDDFDHRAGCPNQILLWIDIEGFELQALRGGSKLLSSGRVRWINIEELRGPAPLPDWTDPRELQEYIERYGYVRICDYNRHRPEQYEGHRQPGHQDVIYRHPGEAARD